MLYRIDKTSVIINRVMTTDIIPSPVAGDTESLYFLRSDIIFKNPAVPNIQHIHKNGSNIIPTIISIIDNIICLFFFQIS